MPSDQEQTEMPITMATGPSLVTGQTAVRVSLAEGAEPSLLTHGRPPSSWAWPCPAAVMTSDSSFSDIQGSESQECKVQPWKCCSAVVHPPFPPFVDAVLRHTQEMYQGMALQSQQSCETRTPCTHSVLFLVLDLDRIVLCSSPNAISQHLITHSSMIWVKITQCSYFLISEKFKRLIH